MSDLSVFNLAEGPAALAAFYVHARSRPIHQRAHWSTDAGSYSGAAEVLFRDYNPGRRDDLVLAVAGCVARAQIEGGEAHVTAAGRTLAETTESLRVLREQIPPMPPAEAGWRPVTFWTWGKYGAESHTRKIQVPAWDDVDRNYPRGVAQQLTDLMHDSFRPASGGQLVLWQGEPGTGKTWALRALVWEWRDWADFNYIVDPDRFFGDEASYLTSVLLDDDDDGRWNVLVLEDCGELLSADAKERVGQALSRLLNVVDGLIGQGLRVIVLVTTNESIKRLHEAVTRPGRCAANVEFTPLNDREVADWLARHDLPTVDVRGRATLAELFALADGRHPRDREPVGFHTAAHH